jgi:2,3-bisphosphoglycerate-independent phosphoglycerate mutase
MTTENQKKQSIPPTILLILDGFGLADPKNKGNAITPETAPNIFKYIKKYPSTELKAHGNAVGLFKDQEGNSEAGHFAIGAGRVVKQDLVTISDAIADGTFFKNEAFKQALQHVKENKTNVHVMGLLSDTQSAHAHPDHLYALLELFRKNDIKNVYLHLFTDGRDSQRHAAPRFLKELEARLQNGEKIASVMGRFFAMDRNKLWDRTEKAYNALVNGKGSCVASSAEKAISQSYEQEVSDEYICPTVIMENGKPVATIKNDDAVFFFNARSDRARQITKAFVQEDFNEKNPGSFKRKKKPKNIRFVAMSEFGPDLPGIFTAFPSPDIDNCIAKAIGESRTQLYISETEKYAHVTYFVNGGFPDPINGEDRELIKSSGHYSYAEKPEMMTKEVVNKILGYLAKQTYDFVCVNLPNADMVGHTGDFEATKKAVRTLDTQVKRLVDTVLKLDGDILLTADHGNAEEMLSGKTAEVVMTEHTTNPVPCILISNRLKKKKLKKGSITDIAPTILKMIGVEKPGEMTGASLF